MTKLENHIRRLFGFTRTGSSLLGKVAREIIPHKEFQRGVGILLIGLVSATFFIHQLGNIGGTLAFESGAATPQTTIDARTTQTVQSPIAFTYESRGLSWFHSGADLVAPTGTPVHPIMAGTVESTLYEPFGYGIHVIVKHSEGYESLYGHLSKIEVKEGQPVDTKTELGLSGSTGFSTGPHLHLEIHQNGVLVNPADLVPGVN